MKLARFDERLTSICRRVKGIRRHRFMFRAGPGLPFREDSKESGHGLSELPGIFLCQFVGRIGLPHVDGVLEKFVA